MMEQNWIEWCQKQFADVAVALDTQGYTPALIESLTKNDTAFAGNFNAFQDDTSRIMNEMAQNPGGFHHYEDFHQAKRSFLKFTNLNREGYLNPAMCA